MSFNAEVHLRALGLARASCMAAIEAIDMAAAGLMPPEPPEEAAPQTPQASPPIPGSLRASVLSVETMGQDE